ncbi:MAG: hypothetical protein SWJ54_12950 [Cyanobacteriota bacterium]|nr:hypothetical protein [Cyanobacteriota bacterium]
MVEKIESGGTGQSQQEMEEQAQQAEQRPTAPSSPTDKFNNRPVPIEFPIASGWMVRSSLPSWFVEIFDYDFKAGVPNEWNLIKIVKTSEKKLNVRPDIHDSRTLTVGVPKVIGTKVRLQLPATYHREVKAKNGTITRKITHKSIRVPSLMSHSCIALWLAKTTKRTGNAPLTFVDVDKSRIFLTDALAQKAWTELGVPDWIKKD